MNTPSVLGCRSTFYIPKDDDAQYRRKEAPDRKEGLGIEPPRDDERGEQHRAEDVENFIARHEEAAAGDHHIHRQERAWELVPESVVDAAVHDVRGDWRNVYEIQEVHTEDEPDHREPIQESSACGVGLDREDRERCVNRPDHIGDSSVGVRCDCVDEWCRERKPDHTFDRLLDTKEERDARQRKHLPLFGL